MRAIVLVDHGSRDPEAAQTLEQVARQLRERVPGRCVAVAHLEITPPTLDDAIAACVAAGASEVVVHPYFLAPGRHSQRDVPRMAEAAAARHPGVRVRVTRPLGAHPALVDAVLDRISEATDRSRSG